MTTDNHHQKSQSLLSRLFRKKPKALTLTDMSLEDTTSHTDVSLVRSPTPSVGGRKRSSIIGTLKHMFPISPNSLTSENQDTTTNNNNNKKNNRESRPKIKLDIHENDALTNMVTPSVEKSADEEFYYINGLPIKIYTETRRKIVKKTAQPVETKENKNDKENDKENDAVSDAESIDYINGLPINVYTDKVKKTAKKTPHLTRANSDAKTKSKKFNEKFVFSKSLLPSLKQVIFSLVVYFIYIRVFLFLFIVLFFYFFLN